MKILCLGAGGVGGYFSARLLQAGVDVTLLLRPGRAALLRRDGLRVHSPLGDWRGAPVLVERDGLSGGYDLIVLACKAYDLDQALEAIAPAVGRGTSLLPFLNGVAHLSAIARRFPEADVWGGVAHIGATLGPDGEIRHLNDLNTFLFGPLRADPDDIRLAEDLTKCLAPTVVKGGTRKTIEQDMWDKLVFLATLAGMTCLMRSDVGTILKTRDGETHMLALLDECEAVARAEGFPPDPKPLEIYRRQLTDPTSRSTASMLRDIQNSKPTEGNHILGDLLRRAEKHELATPLLSLARTHVEAYEISRAAMPD